MSNATPTETPAPANFYAMRRQRNVLADALDNCPRGAFPGSAGASRESAALKALAAFDAANPGVIAEIRRRDLAK